MAKAPERIIVPLPSHSIVPIEDMHKAPVLQTHQLGIDFGGLLGSAPIMPVHKGSADEFIARGGRIPAPMQSLKN